MMILLRASKIKLTPYDFSDLQLAGKVTNIGRCPTGPLHDKTAKKKSIAFDL